MRRLARSLMIVGLMLGAAATTLSAQARRYIGVGGGMAVPTGDYGDATKLGWIAHLIAGFTTSGGLVGGRLDASWIQNKIEATSRSVRLIGATGNLVLTPGRRPADFHPYFLAGLGLYNSKQTDGVGSSETSFAWNAGAGVQFHLGGRTDLYVEGRLLNIRTDNPISVIPVSIGFRWGGI